MTGVLVPCWNLPGPEALRLGFYCLARQGTRDKKEACWLYGVLGGFVDSARGFFFYHCYTDWCWGVWLCLAFGRVYTSAAVSLVYILLVESIQYYRMD